MNVFNFTHSRKPVITKLWQWSKWTAASTLTDRLFLLSQLNYNDPYWHEAGLRQALHCSDKDLVLQCELVALWLFKTEKKSGAEWQKLLVNPVLSYKLYTKPFQSSEVLLVIYFHLHPPHSSPLPLSCFLFFRSISRGLGTLGRVSPAGCVGRALSLIHPQRALWLNRLAQGHEAELRDEGRAGSVELRRNRVIYYRKESYFRLGERFELICGADDGFRPVVFVSKAENVRSELCWIQVSLEEKGRVRHT